MKSRHCIAVNLTAALICLTHLSVADGLLCFLVMWINAGHRITLKPGNLDAAFISHFPFKRQTV